MESLPVRPPNDGPLQYFSAIQASRGSAWSSGCFPHRSSAGANRDPKAALRDLQPWKDPKNVIKPFQKTFWNQHKKLLEHHKRYQNIITFPQLLPLKTLTSAFQKPSKPTPSSWTTSELRWAGTPWRRPSRGKDKRTRSAWLGSGVENKKNSTSFLFFWERGEVFWGEVFFFFWGGDGYFFFWGERGEVIFWGCRAHPKLIFFLVFGDAPGNLEAVKQFFLFNQWGLVVAFEQLAAGNWHFSGCFHAGDWKRISSECFWG